MTVPIIRVPPERKRRAAPDQSPSDTVTLVCTPRLASLFTLVAAPPLPGLPIDVPSGTTASRHLAVTVDAVPLSIHVLARNPQFAGTVDFQLSRIGVLTF